MALNMQNLRPAFTPEEARAMGRKGAAKSAESKRRKRLLSDGLKLLLKQKDETGLTYAQRANLALLRKAMDGDVRAYEAMRDTAGEKPDSTLEHTGAVSVEVSWLAPGQEDADGQG